MVSYDLLYLRRVKLELGEGVFYDSIRNRGEGVKTKMLRLVTKGGRGSKMAVIGVT